MNFLSIFFPKFCFGCGRVGIYLCGNCESKIVPYKTSFCSECGKASIGGLTHPVCKKRSSLDGFICLFEYKDPLKKILHQIKYRFSKNLVEVFDQPLSTIKLPENLKQFEILALPLNRKRENWRGFNQAELLTSYLSRNQGLKSVSNLLERKRFEQSQIKLKLSEREKNLKGAFEVKENLEGRKLIIFDDVWTTGATLRQAGEELKKAGAEQVWGLCLATSHRVH